ncbi:phosphate:Na+ symporter [Elusimicrobium posterum]|uniref:Na/Pi cotransporter family protein n=1 Tax=Elusimicrobium posterum TaxID=3116653 RepID=UPI003C75F905
MSTFLIVLNVLGGLAIFLYGMKLMSEGLQKVAGNSMRSLLAAATTNRFTAMLSGVLVTTIIQSSSATTVMVVGFTSAGLLTLTQALGVIFGANIGTTMTAWIVSFFGFKMQISLFALPVIAIGFFVQFIGKWKTLHRIGETMVGFGLLFLGLELMNNAIPDFSQNPAIMEWLSQFRPDSIWKLFLLIGIGAGLTVLLQSSSAVMAMTITCAAKGFIDFPTCCALVLGENIGTTITANLAAIGATRAARRAALGHFLFNFLGVVWVVLIFKHFVNFVDWVIPGSPYGTNEKTLMQYLPYHISAFHTIFNLINTTVMLCFIRQLAKLTTFIIPKTKREDKTNDLVYLNTRFTVAPDLAIESARKEIERMTAMVSKMLNKLIHAIKVEDDGMFEQLIKDTYALESDTDVIEYKINQYLTALAHQRVSSTTLNEIMALIEITNTVERMADGGEKIGRILEAARVSKEFSAEDLEGVEELALKVKGAVKNARVSLLAFELGGKNKSPKEMLKKAIGDEIEINDLRSKLRDERNLKMAKDSTITAVSASHYSDVLSRLERIGDHALRVVESSISKRTVVKDKVSHNL